MSYNFENKRCLVTGGARGIGREVVKQLVSLNANVVALAKTQKNLDLLKDEFPTVQTICVDLSNWAQTKQAVESLGDFDLLVNNAAFALMAELGKIDEEDIDKHFNTNVKAVINVTQIIASKMKSRGNGGSIVNVSSVAAIMGITRHTVYGASKAALDLMTKVWALELGPFNIRVNSVNPTVTWTDMAITNWSDPKKRDPFLAKHPLGRFCKLEDVSNAIVFLLSDNSNMITGTIMPIDAGFTAT